MIGADILRGIAIGAMGLLSIAGTLELWHIAVVMFFVGVGGAFFNPASTAIVPDLLPENELAQGNALSGALRRLMTSLVGPAIAGLVIAGFGPGPAFVIDGASFAVSAIAVFAIRTRPAPHPPGDTGRPQHPPPDARRLRLRPQQAVDLGHAAVGDAQPARLPRPGRGARCHIWSRTSWAWARKRSGRSLPSAASAAIAMAFAIGHYGLPEEARDA